MSRVYGPKKLDHPSIGAFCPMCNTPFVEGDYTTLQGMRPASEKDAEKAAQGKPHTVEVVEIHAKCPPVTPELTL